MLQIFIVSLKQDVDRRKAISNILEGFGLNFTFVDAIYGKDLSKDYLNSIIEKSSGAVLSRGFPPAPGEIGCTLSHLKTYKEVLDRNLQWACILEDDVILDKRFATFITTFQSNDLDKNNAYLLGGQNGLGKQYIIKSFKNIHNIGGQKFYKTIRSEKSIFGTCCYLISSALAKRLLDLSEAEFILADDWHYLVKNRYVNSIYLSNFVDHPTDLSNSHIESERSIKFLNNSKENFLFYKKSKVYLRRYIRLILLNSYRFIEKKD